MVMACIDCIDCICFFNIKLDGQKNQYKLKLSNFWSQFSLVLVLWAKACYE